MGRAKFKNMDARLGLSPLTFKLHFSKNQREALSTLGRYYGLMNSYITPGSNQLDKLALCDDFRKATLTHGISGAHKPDHLNQFEVGIVHHFCLIAKKYNFEEPWMRAIYDAVALKSKRSSYKTEEDLSAYIYGYAEVLGLMVSRILGLARAADSPARLQARILGLSNFIYNLKDDALQGKTFIASSDLAIFGLNNLTPKEVASKPTAFKELLNFQVRRIKSMQSKVKEASYFIPYRQRIIIKTASDINLALLKKISKNPVESYNKKMGLSRAKLMAIYLSNFITAL